MQITINARGPKGQVEIKRTTTGAEVLAIDDGEARLLCEVTRDADEEAMYEAAKKTAGALYGLKSGTPGYTRTQLRDVAALIEQALR